MRRRPALDGAGLAAHPEDLIREPVELRPDDRSVDDGAAPPQVPRALRIGERDSRRSWWIRRWVASGSGSAAARALWASSWSSRWLEVLALFNSFRSAPGFFLAAPATIFPCSGDTWPPSSASAVSGRSASASDVSSSLFAAPSDVPDRCASSSAPVRKPRRCASPDASTRLARRSFAAPAARVSGRTPGTARRHRPARSRPVAAPPPPPPWSPAQLHGPGRWARKTPWVNATQRV